MEARRLSSRATGLYKVAALGFVALWLMLSIVPTAQSPELSWQSLVFPLVGVLLFCVVYLLVGRSKKVELVGDVFVISSGSRTIEIPIRDVESVGGSRFSNPERMWIDLRRPSEFGSRIHFLPPQRWFNIFSMHPLVAELRFIVEHGAAAGRMPVEQAEPWPLWQRIAIGAAGVLAFATILVTVVTSAFKSSDPYQQAVSMVQASPAARQQLGTPIEPAWFVTGSIRTMNDGGSAAMQFSVSGVDSDGSVRLVASREAGIWQFSYLVLHVGDRTIDLLDE